VQSEAPVDFSGVENLPLGRTAFSTLEEPVSETLFAYMPTDSGHNGDFSKSEVQRLKEQFAKAGICV